MRANSFIIYVEQYSALQQLTDAQLGELFRGIFSYRMGKEPGIKDPIVNMAFSFMKNQLDIDARKYEQRCKKNRDAIKSRWDKAKANSSEYKGIQTNTSVSHQIPNENYNYHENENENDNNNDNGNGKMAKQTATRFRPPTIKDVQDFCDDEGLSIDTQRFVNYYAAQGWKLSNGNNMKDWHAAARNWARKDGQEQQSVLDIPATNATDYQQGFR